jgi:hypothetical protein
MAVGTLDETKNKQFNSKINLKKIFYMFYLRMGENEILI